MTSKQTFFLLLLFVFTTFIAFPNPVSCVLGPGAIHPPSGPPLSRSEAIQTIRSILEAKLAGEHLPPKALEKLHHLSDTQLNLLVSLSKRMAGHQETVGADMAFLMITALLVLS